MKLENRIAALEESAPAETRTHVILFADHAIETALDEYGRDRIAMGDRVQFIELFSGEHGE